MNGIAVEVAFFLFCLGGLCGFGLYEVIDHLDHRGRFARRKDRK